MFSLIHISILGSIQGDQLIGVSIFPSGNGCVATLSLAGDFNLPTSGEVPSSNSIDKVLAVINETIREAIDYQSDPNLPIAPFSEFSPSGGYFSPRQTLQGILEAVPELIYLGLGGAR